MAERSQEIRTMLEQKDRDFMMGMTKVKMRTSVENLDAGDHKIVKAAEGESVEIPRWVAEELVALNLAEGTEETFEAEIARALSKEKMMGPLQLSFLPQDFYMRMRRRLVSMAAGAKHETKKEDFEKMKNACYDLIGMRLSKLLSLSSSSSQGSSLEDRLTPEEDVFFSVSQALSKEWRAALLGSVA